MSILNEDPIDAGLLIGDNIKFMADEPQQSCGQFCVINELRGLAWVPTQNDDVMINPMVPISKSTMSRLPS